MLSLNGLLSPGIMNCPPPIALNLLWEEAHSNMHCGQSPAWELLEIQSETCPVFVC